MNSSVTVIYRLFIAVSSNTTDFVHKGCIYDIAKLINYYSVLDSLGFDKS